VLRRQLGRPEQVPLGVVELPQVARRHSQVVERFRVVRLRGEMGFEDWHGFAQPPRLEQPERFVFAVPV
jgi:hypothetical protein